MRRHPAEGGGGLWNCLETKCNTFVQNLEKGIFRGMRCCPLPANILSPLVLKQTEFAATTSSIWSYARYVALRVPVKASHMCSGWSRLVLTKTLVTGSADDMCGYLRSKEMFREQIDGADCPKRVHLMGGWMDGCSVYTFPTLLCT